MGAPARLSSLRYRLGATGAFTLVEMLVVMTLLGLVLAALTALLLSGTRAEADLVQRMQAQQEARLALDELRREIHCANSVTQMDGADLPSDWTGSGIRITLGAYCPSAPIGGAVTWCTTSSGAVSSLQRIPTAASTCTGGTNWADHLVSGDDVFSYTPPDPGELTAVGVDLIVDVTPSDVQQRYRLQDAIVLRNTQRPEPPSEPEP